MSKQIVIRTPRNLLGDNPDWVQRGFVKRSPSVFIETHLNVKLSRQQKKIVDIIRKRYKEQLAR